MFLISFADRRLSPPTATPVSHTPPDRTAKQRWFAAILNETQPLFNPKFSWPIHPAYKVKMQSVDSPARATYHIRGRTCLE